MKNQQALRRMSIDELVARFTTIALKQYEVIFYNQNTKYNRLFRDMNAVKDELKSRAGDERRALTSLYSHPNIQVRFAAAHANLAIGYAGARNVIQQIADSKDYPFAADAGMALLNLDRGVYKPV